MEESSRLQIEECLKQQRRFFGTYQSRNIQFRIQQLKNFKASILNYEEKIKEALWKDLHKSNEEAYLTEISLVIGEINYHIKNLKSWTKPEKVITPIHLLPSRSRILYEPLGVALIIAPWNYPFQLLMNPLVGAISSGCCALIKPSPKTSHIAKVMEDLIHETFTKEYICIIQGGRSVIEILLQQRFDMIFFTGSPAVGKVVMKAASEHLTPVVLELGGKSPCIVDKDANLDIAAKRIVWGKTINAGQTCIAPDYLFVHELVNNELLKLLIKHIEEMYGSDIQKSSYFPRIVNAAAFNRIKEYLNQGRIVYGGTTDAEERFISPTIIEEIKPTDSIMQDEIFGPVLPVMTYKDITEAIDYINAHEKPLAFYYFGKNCGAKEVLSKTTSGGGCINDTLMHITNHNLPFGGVGNSGMGKYHGYTSFLAFSHSRSIVYTPTWLDLPLKYAPFKYFKLIKKII